MNEQAYLSAALVDAGVLDAHPLGPEHFTAHRRDIFRVMRRLRDNGLGCDYIALKTESPEAWQHGMLEICVSEGIPSMAGYYATKLKADLERRALGHIRTVVDSGLADGSETAEIRADVERALYWTGGATGAVHVKDIVAGAVKMLERGKGMTSGFSAIDRIYNGHMPGDLIILAARPGMGKSALAGGLAVPHASAGKKCVIFSLEMTKEQWINRLACSIAGVSYHRIIHRQAQQDEYPRLVSAMGELAGYNLLVEETPGINISDFRSIVRREKPAIVIVDYLQLMTAGKAESRTQEVSEISRQLKAAAKESGTTVIALSQLNRSLESRADKRPDISSLRESGQIEQDADSIWFLYREAQYCEACKLWKCNDPHRFTAELDIAKQRNGPTGVAFLRWQGDTMTFSDRGREEESYP